MQLSRNILFRLARERCKSDARFWNLAEYGSPQVLEGKPVYWIIFFPTRWVAESGLEEVLSDSSSDESVMNLRSANFDLVLDVIEHQLIALKLYN